MTKLQSIIRDFKTAPVPVKSPSVKPTAVTRAQSRSQTKKAMAAGLARSRETA
jgi:Na+-transporting methylmalonyl-CoA/oxaloacetate decarboxylase gamma subunit